MLPFRRLDAGVQLPRLVELEGVHRHVVLRAQSVESGHESGKLPVFRGDAVQVCGFGHRTHTIA